MNGNNVDKWQRKYEQLKFAKENPNSSERISSGKLNSWITSQRIKYKDGKLTFTQIKALKEIGIELVASTKDYETEWEDAYKYLEDYFASNGNLYITNTRVTEDGFKLGRWLVSQRAKYCEDKLSLDKVNRLNNMYMIWSVRDNNKELKALCEKYHIYYSINKDRMCKLPVARIEYMINFLIDRDIPYIDSNGYLKDIVFVPYIENMLDKDIKEDYSYMLVR